tara:strand:+ start:1466 stop:2407 length:942 start_codon:yes stop_codon:yes gene_type:complete
MQNILGKIKHFIVFSRFGRNYRPDTPKAASIFYKIMTIIHNSEFKERKKYLETINDKIDPKIGYKIINQSQIFQDLETQNALSALKENYAKINWEDTSEFKKPFLRTKKIEISIELQKIVLKLIPMVSEYIGSLAILQDALYWYSPNIFNEEGRSQNWHMDAEDKKQIRVLIPIEDVKEDSGPMVVINSTDTSKIYNSLQSKNKIKYRNEKISDETMQKFNFNHEKIIVEKDQIAFVDTCNCYHYGSRKSTKPRKLISLQFTSAFSIFTPIFKRKTKISEFNDRKTQLVFCFIKDNYHKIKNTKLKKWELKIL